MNLDLSIHRMAFRTAQTLGEAQLQMVKMRADLDRALVLRQTDDGVAPTGRVIEQAMADLQQHSDQMAKATERHRLDKLG